MEVTIFGAGAIGGVAAARMALAGIEVAVVARGAHLEAIRRDGLTLATKTERQTVKLRTTDKPAELGPSPILVTTMKAHSIAPALEAMRPLIGPETVVVPVLNGIPWWYEFPGGPLRTVDPEGRLAASLPPARVIGGVVYGAATVTEPGVVSNTSATRYALGEAGGGLTTRLERVAALFRKAGLQPDSSADIRREVWAKVWGNAPLNPISVVTGGSVADLCDDTLVRDVIARVMEETRAVAGQYGIALEGSVEDRIDGARPLGSFRSSMLQDFTAGRPIELDVILGAIIELGERAGVATPVSSVVYALTRQRAALARK